MKDNNIQRQHLYGTLYFAQDFLYITSLYCPHWNPGMRLIIYKIARWYRWDPEKENDLLTAIQAGGVMGELELGPSESLCYHCPPSSFWSFFTSQGMPMTASALLSWQVMYVISSLQWTPGLADSCPATEAKKTKVGRRLPCTQQAGTVCAQYRDFLL